MHAMLLRINGFLTIALAALFAAPAPAVARTVYRCVQDGVVSLATAPEPGSSCEAREIDDTSAKAPNLWGALGTVKGNLYKRQQDGRTVYSTRELPGSEQVLAFTVETPASVPAHTGLGFLGPPRVDVYAEQFEAASRASGVDDALLRAVAHAESAFDPKAVSPKGALGVMQLMPETAAQYRVKEPFSSRESITAGATHLGNLLKLYEGDLTLTAAAYNAGVGAVKRYGGVPPYAETQAYVAKVVALHQRYRQALSAP